MQRVRAHRIRLPPESGRRRRHARVSTPIRTACGSSRSARERSRGSRHAQGELGLAVDETSVHLAGGLDLHLAPHERPDRLADLILGGFEARPPGPRIRVALDRSILTAYAEDTTPLWRKDFGEPIVHAEAVDLDADALSEVVVGFRNRMDVFDRDGRLRWTRASDSRTLQTFTTGDLFEKHTHQIVALWNDSRSSRLSVFESEGRERSSRELVGPLLYVAVGRPTNMHAPKIVVASNNAVLLFHPRKLDRGTPIWRRLLRHASSAISELRIVDASSGRHRDIAVVTVSGTTTFTFEGKIVGQSREESWEEGARRKKR